MNVLDYRSNRFIFHHVVSRIEITRTIRRELNSNPKMRRRLGGFNRLAELVQAIPLGNQIHEWEIQVMGFQAPM